MRSGDEPRHMRRLTVALMLVVVSFSYGCGSSCGLELKQRVCFPGFRTPPNDCDWPSANLPQIECCGASLHQDFNLTADDVQVDLINQSGDNGRVDVFLTDEACGSLFTAPYTGVVTSTPCKIYLGPVPRGGPTQRTLIRRGKYRVFEQAYSTNQSSVQFLMEFGLWSESCRWNPVTP